MADESNEAECIFGYMALHIECRFNKNFHPVFFLVILPAGIKKKKRNNIPKANLFK